jgi:hypothetical protein
LTKFEYHSTLPEWYDEKGNMTTTELGIFITHPEHPCHFFNEETKQWEQVHYTGDTNDKSN